jgi:hypothetical protein
MRFCARTSRIRNRIATSPSGTPTPALMAVDLLSGERKIADADADSVMVTVDAVRVSVDAANLTVEAGKVSVVAGRVGAVETVCQFVRPMIVITEGWPLN